MDDADVQMQLAVELAKVEPTWRHAKIVAAALLPVVREIADQRAAEELDEAAAEGSDRYGIGFRIVPAARLSARAAALRGEARR